SAGRVAFSAVRAARAQGIPVGLLRPITLRPFPYAPLAELAKTVKALLVVEMNAGQMLDDVLLAAAGHAPVEFYGRMGGMVPYQGEILAEIVRIAGESIPLEGDPRHRWAKRVNYGRNGHN
ncbi:MAG TPA: 3-methyl-2-oxobutanoate dehydrogenase subunit beta, partial [Anaerolineales bacterium]|nr:3-methyl-2-oxobutanoate dehydrogenase subunit beta [Anaerolineales bacterium]